MLAFVLCGRLRCLMSWCLCLICWDGVLGFVGLVFWYWLDSFLVLLVVGLTVVLC